MPRSLIPVMTPHGSLRVDHADDDFVLESGLADRLEKSWTWQFYVLAVTGSVLFLSLLIA